MPSSSLPRESTEVGVDTLDSGSWTLDLGYWIPIVNVGAWKQLESRAPIRIQILNIQSKPSILFDTRAKADGQVEFRSSKLLKVIRLKHVPQGQQRLGKIGFLEEFLQLFLRGALAGHLLDVAGHFVEHRQRL